MTFEECFPPIDTTLEMEPEELGPFILKYLSEQSNINRYNFTLDTNFGMREYAGNQIKEFTLCLMEGWMWLEKELFIAPTPGTQDGWAFITRRGKLVLEAQDFDNYLRGSLLNTDGLDPILTRKVKPTFIRGDSETAVFQAFKEVEIRVRTKCGLPNTVIGVNLMRDAFKPVGGILTDRSAEKSEQESTMALFTGAIGLFKNPTSHRHVDFTNPHEVVDLIGVANQLLRIVDQSDPRV